MIKNETFSGCPINRLRIESPYLYSLKSRKIRLLAKPFILVEARVIEPLSISQG